MPECLHKNLVLLKEPSGKLRCHHCHLTLATEELQDGFCPECYETSGKKRYEFDTIAAEHQGKTRYRCEDCGVIIEVDTPD